MWSEVTNQSIWYNLNFEPTDIGHGVHFLLRNEDFILIYQKALLLVLYLTCFITFLNHYKERDFILSLLLLIMVGGFLFHTLWEAKSRYIIPYIIVLMPISSVQINKKKHLK